MSQYWLVGYNYQNLKELSAATHAELYLWLLDSVHAYIYTFI